MYGKSLHTHELIRERFEQHFLRKHQSMTPHDLIMCANAFLEHTDNPDLYARFARSLMRQHDALLQAQRKDPNIGLVAYVLSQKGVHDEECWRRLFWIFVETRE